MIRCECRLDMSKINVEPVLYTNYFNNALGIVDMIGKIRETLQYGPTPTLRCTRNEKFLPMAPIGNYPIL